MFKRSKASLNAHYWLCAALSPLTDPDKVVQLNKSYELNWDMVMEQAHHGMVLPALYHSLLTKGLLHLAPDEVAQALQGFFELNVELNGRRRDQVYAISTCLNDKDIGHIWLKGATHLLRKDWKLSPRMMLDIDIWIPNESQHKQAFIQLTELGYEFLDSDQEQEIDHDHHHYPPLYKPNETARLEFHQHLISREFFSLLPDMTALPNVQWLDWQGQTVGVLSHADQAMQAYVQCVHMSGNQFLTGQVTLMKTHDFVERLLQAGSRVLESDQFSLLRSDPWKKRAETFFTCLHHAFGFQSNFQKKSTYESRLHYPILASFAKFQGVSVRIIECIKEGRIGPLKELPKRIWRNMHGTFSVKNL